MSFIRFFYIWQWNDLKSTCQRSKIWTRIYFYFELCCSLIGITILCLDCYRISSWFWILDFKCFFIQGCIKVFFISLFTFSSIPTYFSTDEVPNTHILEKDSCSHSCINQSWFNSVFYYNLSSLSHTFMVSVGHISNWFIRLIFWTWLIVNSLYTIIFGCHIDNSIAIEI